MGLYKIFKDVFYDIMARHGFIHQGNVFIRIVGEDIVQAVTIKPISSYFITAAIFPMYLPCNGFDESYVGSKKPYWAEDKHLTFHGFVDFPHTHIITYLDGDTKKKMFQPTPFFDKENYLSDTIENLKKAAEIMETFYIPQFDKIVDFNSYFEWINTPLQERSFLCGREIITAESLVYKSYIDGNFDFGRAYIKENVEENLKILGNEEYVSRMIANAYKIFYDSANNNDASWIVEHFNTEKCRVKKILRETYSKLKIED